MVRCVLRGRGGGRGGWGKAVREKRSIHFISLPGDLVNGLRKLRRLRRGRG